MAEAGSAERLKVFISYSRRDSTEFADELVDGLELAGFAPFLDRHDILPGEKWEERLGGLIAQADTVVFVVSPEAVKSERCAWEVRQTLEQSKRLLPVMFKPVAEADIPEKLRERQFVRFDVAGGITRPLRELAQALRRDIDWIREHTRVGDMAARWEARGRLPSLLLRGDDVAAAEVWMDNRKPDAPAISDAMRAFIAASKEADDAYRLKTSVADQRVVRSRRLIAFVTATFAILLVTGLVAWWQEIWLRHRIYALMNVHTLATAQESSFKPNESFKECTDCPEMVVVSAGSFMMGSPEGQGDKAAHPQHTVTIAKPFAVSKYELTFDEWDACAAQGSCNAHVVDSGFGRGQQPVINVSWVEAKQYVVWLSKITGKPYRLLTEAEYEYAARAGSTTVYPWGDDIKLNGMVMANCDGCGSKWDLKQTAPVGSFPPNKFGLYDMVGNVWEWMEDCFHDSYQGAPADGSAWISSDCTLRVLRGGSWNFDTEDVRSAERFRDGVVVRIVGVGFRVARPLLAP